MKIFVVSTPVFAVCPPAGTTGYSGLEVIAWLCAKGLAEKGHQVKLAAPDGSSCPGAEIIPIGQAGHWNEKDCFPRYAPHLLDADVVIDHSWTKASFLLKREGRLSIPILSVMHAPADGMYRSVPVPKPCFVCISNDQASHLKALLNCDARVAYNGVDSSFYHPLDVARTDRFLFLARFSSIKGPAIAIESCRKAGVGLDLVGDCSITQEPDYFRHCQSMCDGKQIRMVGPCSRGNSVWWFSQAKALLHPVKHFREPFGLAPVEAMLCQTPVISFANGATVETVKHGVSGLLVRSEEEMLAAIQSDWINNITETGRQECRNWALRFSVENMVDRYEELAIEAIETGGW